MKRYLALVLLLYFVLIDGAWASEFQASTRLTCSIELVRISKNNSIDTLVSIPRGLDLIFHDDVVSFAMGKLTGGFVPIGGDLQIRIESLDLYLLHTHDTLSLYEKYQTVQLIPQMYLSYFGDALFPENSSDSLSFGWWHTRSDGCESVVELFYSAITTIGRTSCELSRQFLIALIHTHKNGCAT